MPILPPGKTSNPINPNAATLETNRRNWQRLPGATTGMIQVIPPITNTGGIGFAFNSNSFTVVGGVFTFTLLTAKGDLATYSTQPSRLPVGSDGELLSADSTTATGLKWIPDGPGIVFVDKEVPTGVIDGTNTLFTLANTPTAGSEQVIINGLMLYPGLGNDYTMAGGLITFLTGAIPQTGDRLFVNYRM